MSTIIVQEGNAGTVVVESSTAPTVTIGPVETVTTVVGPLTATGAFTDLTDTPLSLSNEANNFVVVNPAGTGLTFSDTVPPPYVISYDYNTAENIVVSSEAYVEVCRLTTPNRPAAVYEIKMSMLWHLDNKSRAAFFRSSLNGGTDWLEVVLRPNDLSAQIPNTLIWPITHSGGVFDMVIEAHTEIATDILTLRQVSIICESKVT